MKKVFLSWTPFVGQVGMQRCDQNNKALQSLLLEWKLQICITMAHQAFPVWKNKYCYCMETKTKKEKKNGFYVLRWWMKGKISALSCLGYGSTHFMSKGECKEGLWVISSQGSSPCLVLLPPPTFQSSNQLSSNQRKGHHHRLPNHWRFIVGFIWRSYTILSRQRLYVLPTHHLSQ